MHRPAGIGHLEIGLWPVVTMDGLEFGSWLRPRQVALLGALGLLAFLLLEKEEEEEKRERRNRRRRELYAIRKRVSAKACVTFHHNDIINC
jgi:hypothetical protein